MKGRVEEGRVEGRAGVWRDCWGGGVVRRGTEEDEPFNVEPFNDDRGDDGNGGLIPDGADRGVGGN